jgi:hypothetical protein
MLQEAEVFLVDHVSPSAATYHDAQSAAFLVVVPQWGYLGGRPPFGWVYDADKKLEPVPEQQQVLRRIRKLAGEGLSPRKISRTLAMRGVKLSHVTIRKIIAGQRSTAPS